MAYDHEIADRVRCAVSEQAASASIVERAMFGGLCFMLDGNMAVCVMGDGVLVRVGKDGMDDALRRGADLMRMGERTMDGFVVVDAERVVDDEALDGWVATGVGLALSLPSK